MAVVFGEPFFAFKHGVWEAVAAAAAAISHAYSLRVANSGIINSLFIITVCDCSAGIIAKMHNYGLGGGG